MNKNYLENKQRYKNQAKERKRILMYMIVQLKKRPCFDCWIQYPSWVMQFDHVRGKKIADVHDLVMGGNLQKILDEITKCEIVCANCHAQRTHKRQISEEI